MKRILTSSLAAAIAAGRLVAGLASSAQAQPRHHDRDHRDHRYEREYRDNGRHHGWRKGGHIERRDWRRGQRVDYRRHKLRAPPRGYEWRRVDDSYVLAAVATGLIASIIIANQ